MERSYGCHRVAFRWLRETALYADDMKYGSMRSAEEYGFTIEAYTYPEEFAVLDGTASPESATGVYLGQQSRGVFRLLLRHYGR